MSEESGQKGQCGMKKALEADGHVVERCPVRLVVDEDVRRKVVAAIQKGESDGMAELTGTLLAGMHMLSAQELGKLLEEGMSVTYDVASPDGESFLSMTKTNPRAEPTLKLLDMVGATAAQQSITPKSKGEQKRDEGMGELAELLTRRAALAAGPPEPEG